ncbi:MAG: hypothetical protein KU37_10240 [Sulfuricurvum sp. PC08-66]|nr:MAG: hypothetical protein KU37_10240 [Sulfuricurvum sp. PC08-66]
MQFSRRLFFWLLVSLYTMHASTHALFSHRIQTALHSNLSMIQPDSATLYNYLSSTYFPMSLTLSTYEKGPKWSVSLDSIGDVLMDWGEEGAWYHRVGYVGHLRQVKNSIMLDDNLLYGSYTLGYVGFLGALEWQIALGFLHNGLAFNNRIESLGQTYLIMQPSYTFAWENGTQFFAQIIHQESKSLTPLKVFDTNGSFISEELLRREYNAIALRLEGPIFARDAYMVELGVAGFNSSSYGAKFSSFNQHALALDYTLHLNETMRLALHASLTTRNFGSLIYDESYYGISNYDYANDPLNLLREDHISQFKIEYTFAHDKTWYSSIAYALTTVESDFPAIDPQMHELSYALYWLP